MFNYFALLLAVAAGIGAPFQLGVNTQLRHYVHTPIMSAFISFLGGTLVLIVLIAIGVLGRGEFAGVTRAPWWTLIGGFFGAFYVTAAIIVSPRIGATTTAAAIIFGQLVTSVVLDHFGLVGFPRIPISIPRLVGAIMLLGGVILIQRR